MRRENSSDILIAVNQIYDLVGTTNAQAFFGRADYVDDAGVDNPFRFENVRVINNLFVTQHANAIAFT